MKKIIILFLATISLVSCNVFEKEHLDKEEIDKLSLPKWSKEDF